MNSARAWKEYYARERAALGEAGLLARLEHAEGWVDPLLAALAHGGALVFPHTRLEVSGDLPAAVALAAVRSGRAEVLALGVLHGAREADAALVQAARAGEVAALGTLRRVHGPGVPDDARPWEEEFSPDNFCAPVDAAARRGGLPAPRVVCRYPFLTGSTPADLPGMDELAALVADGAALVATTDPIHHGVGYGLSPEECWPLEAASTTTLARAAVEEGFHRLAARDYAAFLEHAAALRSDFRDVGPVLAHLLPAGPLHATIHDLRLVDYAEALASAPPTWVAAALASIGPLFTSHSQP